MLDSAAGQTPQPQSSSMSLDKLQHTDPIESPQFRQSIQTRHLASEKAGMNCLAEQKKPVERIEIKQQTMQTISANNIETDSLPPQTQNDRKS